MKKYKLTSFIVILLITCAATAIANDRTEEENKILSAAENVFVQMKNKDYPAIWEGLSNKTKEVIINDVYKAAKKMKIEIAKDELISDFNNNGTNAKAYWDSYLNVFDPAVVLEQCKWYMSKVKADTAEIYILKKDSERPALLKLYKENGAWKLGLEESFGARKLNPF